MVFTDIDYVILLTLTFFACVVARRLITRNVILLTASYVFYGWWDWRFLSLIIFSSCVDYFAGLAIDGRFNWLPRYVNRKLLLLLSISANLGLLIVFKYMNFFIDSLIVALSNIDITVQSIYLRVILPVGISFYTFQSMSYSIDVYRGKQRAETNPINFLLYVSFFPQLVAGPIERASNLLTQINQKRRLNYFRFRSGIELIAFGLFKKMFIADNLARIVENAFNSPNAGFYAIALGVYAFAFQIYCDFSGYTDIARGSAKLLGFDLRLNFNTPYFSANPREFWRRWHMSLSTWIRDYVYIPLGGTTRQWGRTAFNLMLTMALCGLWHGAAWNFVLWGIYHGVLITFSPKANEPNRTRGHIRPFQVNWSIRHIFGLLITFNLVCIGWLIFRVESIDHLISLVQNAWMLPINSGFQASSFILFLLLASPLLSIELWLSIAKKRDMRGFSEATRWGISIALIYIAIIGQPAETAPFIYFQF